MTFSEHLSKVYQGWKDSEMLLSKVDCRQKFNDEMGSGVRFEY